MINPKLLFYTLLDQLLTMTDEEPSTSFNMNIARRIMQVVSEYGASISFKVESIAELRLIFDAYMPEDRTPEQEKANDAYTLAMFKGCLTDLGPQLRNKKARDVLGNFYSHVGDGTPFMHVRHVNRIGRSNGLMNLDIGAVTLVGDLGYIQGLLLDPKRFENIPLIVTGSWE